MIDKDELTNWIKHKAETSMRNLSVTEFSRKLKNAVSLNDISIIPDIMSPEFCPMLSKSVKEQIIFSEVSSLYTSTGVGEEFLKYMIFDYNINEITSITENSDNRIKAMFRARNLNSELNAKLKDSHEPNKKIKI